jgi:two-component system sensor histidine kinase YesM
MGDHLRYMLADRTIVPLNAELNESANFVELSCLRFPNGLVLRTDINPALENAVVLPMIIQIFIENTVKHEIVNGKQMEVYIVANFTDADKSRVRLTIWDTGCGWSDEILNQLNSGEMLHREDGYRIGIRNLHQRMTLEFEGDFQMRFSNHPDAGAQIEIEFPYRVYPLREED